MTEENNNNTPKAKGKIFLSVLNIFCCLLFVAGILLYVNLGRILDNFIDVDFIKQNVKNSTGLILEFDKPVMHTTKDFCINIKSDEISLLAPDDLKHPLLNIKDTELGIKIIPLIFKKIDFKNLTASSLEAYIVRDKDRRFNFTKYIKTGGNFPFTVTAENANVMCDKYSVLFVDNYIGESALIAGKDLVLAEFDLNRAVDIETKGEIKLSRGRMAQVSPYAMDLKLKLPLNKNLDFRDYDLDLSISDINFELFEPYLKEFVSKDIRQFKGKSTLVVTPSDDKINVKLDLDDIAINIYKNGHENHIDIPNPSRLAFKTNFKKDVIFINDLSFLKDGIDFHAEGSLKNLSNNKNLNPDFTLTFKETSAKEALKIAPDYLVKMQHDYIPDLKKYNVNGIVNGTLRIKDRLRYPNMYGKLEFRDVYVLERPTNAKTSKGSVAFEGDKVLVDVHANCPHNEYVSVKGTTQIKALPYAEFDIRSSKAIDLAFAHKILLPVRDILEFQLGPLPYMTIAGTGEISLKTAGTRDNAVLNGYVKVPNGTATLDGLNTRLTNGNLNLLFKGKTLIFDGTTGLIEGAKATLGGTSNVDGNLDLKIKVADVSAERALNVAKTSDMVVRLLNGAKFLDAYTNPKGNIDFNLRIFGKADKNMKFGDFSNVDPNGPVKAEGSIVFKNNALKIFPEIYASKVNGVLKFTDFCTLDLTGDIYNSPFKMTGTVSPDTRASKKRSEQPQVVDLTFNSKSVLSKDLYSFFYLNQDGFQSKNRIDKNLYDFLNKINFKFAVNIRAKGKVAPDAEILDMKKFTLDGYAVGMNYKGSDVFFNSGDVRFFGQKMYFRNLNAVLWDANVITNGNIDKIFDDYFIPDLDFKLVSFPMEKFNDIKTVSANPGLQKLLSDFVDFKGTLNGDFDYEKTGFTGHANLNQISFFDKRRDMPVVLNSGDVNFSNSTLKLNALNFTYGATPFYLDAVVDNLAKTPNFNVFASTNLTEESFDKFINPMLQFPVKLKNEIALRGRLKGTLDDYTAFGTLVLEPGSDLYYMGANLGDVQHRREMYSKIDFSGDKIGIDSVVYRKFILSQNNKQTPYEMLKVTGKLNGSHVTKGLVQDYDKITMQNLRIQTQNPAPARLLNLIFKKSVLKQGTFTSDITLNGPMGHPEIKGTGHLSNVDVPLYDANIKDVDLSLDDDIIKAVFQGTGFGSDVKFSAEIVNSLKLPVVINNADVESNFINLDTVIKNLGSISKSLSAQDVSSDKQTALSPMDLEIKNGTFKVNEIAFNNAHASNFKGKFKHTKDGTFIFDDVTFDIAGGTVNSAGSYEFPNATFTINSAIEDCDANALSSDILGAKNQIFGTMNGKVYLTGHDLNTPNGINNIKATVDFSIHDGKMPKLGSLEYLLRAGNLIKSGILGFTINNVIEILIPYRTGEFKRISGDFIVQDGVLDKLNLYSEGENLSIYTSGSYDIGASIGDFEILGKLSTKISNLLGPIGNLSVNSLMNVLTNNKINKEVKEDFIQNVDKIPNIGSSSNEFRLFAAKILGDLNKEGYVRTFNWLN